jgi:uncharacterized protein YhbP (UPF0306 family)
MPNTAVITYNKVMPDPRDILKEHLANTAVMQLATCADNEPWACNLHFYSDDDLNIYWISSQESLHSQQIAANPKVAAAILTHANTPGENYVVGMSIGGTAELLDETEVDAVNEAYCAKHTRLPEEVREQVRGEAANKFYVLRPNKIILIDSLNFTGSPRQEIKL